jgi:hypothetical protein
MVDGTTRAEYPQGFSERDFAVYPLASAADGFGVADWFWQARVSVAQATAQGI